MGSYRTVYSLKRAARFFFIARIDIHTGLQPKEPQAVKL